MKNIHSDRFDRYRHDYRDFGYKRPVHHYVPNRTYYPDYTIDTIFVQNFNSFLSKKSESDESIIFLTELINIFLMPTISLASFLLNVVCVAIFSSPKLKSTLYKYLQANSITDLITLLLAIIGSFAKLTETAGITFSVYTSAQFFFVFLSYTTLTISNFIKIAMTFDRIFRLKKVCKFYTKKSAFGWIIFIIVAFSVGANVPKIVFHDLITYEWQHSSFLIFTLTYAGKQKSAGLMVVITSILLEFVPIIMVIILSIVMIVVVKHHLKKLKTIEDMSAEDELEAEKVAIENGGVDVKVPIGEPTTKPVRKRINFDIYDEDDSEDESEMDVVVIANIENDSIIEPEKKSNSDETSEGMDVKMKRRDSVKSETDRTDIDVTRYLLTKMININCLVYILGHLFFAFCSVFIQVKYFFYYGPLMNMYKDAYPLLNLLIAISYILLYVSFGANFFIYFAFNGSFRRILNNDDKKPVEEEKLPIEGEEGSNANPDAILKSL